MSELLFLDSADHYTVGIVTRKWTAWPGGTMPVARTGNGLRITGQVYKTLGPTYTTITLGSAYYTDGLVDAIIRCGNLDQPPGSGWAFDLRHVGDGRLRAWFQGTLGPPSTFVMAQARWYYVELQGIFSGIAPNFTVDYIAKVNNQTILSGSLAATIGGFAGPIVAATVWLGGSVPNGATHDDHYVTDDEFLSDLRIAVIYPNADGDLGGWTPSTPGAHYLMTKEHDPDDDTTYIKSSVVNDEELQHLDDISGFTGTIKGIQALWCVKKSDAGPASFKGELKSGGVTVQTEEFFPSDMSYLYFRKTYRKSPFTGLDWTVAEVNGLQQGIIRIT